MILLVDKPEGMTSHDVVSKIKHASPHRLKIGHTGTLDPMCTGLLPVLTGADTRLSQFFPHEKEYLASVRFGISTDTGDVWGKVRQQTDVTVSEADVCRALNSFVGVQDQIPPMYSALRVGGRRLYELARNGEEVERKPRKIEIFSVAFQGAISENEFSFAVACSAGTYIRTLCEDLGQALGIPAAMSALRRTRSNGFSLENALPLSEVVAHARQETLADLAVSPEVAFAALPACTIPDDGLVYYLNGGTIALSRLNGNLDDGERFRCYAADGRFLGLAQRTQDAGAVKQIWKGEMQECP